MTSDKRKAINDLAVSIRKALNLSTPLNLQDVVLQLKGKLLPVTFDESSVSGKIQKKDGTFEISYNAEESPNRIGFTIAHELGHLFLHMGYLFNPEKWNSIDEYCDSPKYRQGYSEEEYEANEFAAAFLMPKEEYITFVKENLKDNRISLYKISDHFGVSDDAALTRGKWLGIFSW